MLTQTVLFPELERHQSRCNGEEFSPMVIAEAPEAVRQMPTTTIEEKIAKAKAVLKWVMSRYTTAYSTSHGKDSSTTVGLALSAAAEMVRDGIPVKPFVILTADTGVENPAIAALAHQEMGKINAWIERHGLPGSMHVAEPHLASTFAVSIIGGRAIPSMQGHKRDCTVDWKVEPLTRLRKALLGTNDLASGRFTVSITGVRRECCSCEQPEEASGV